MKVDAAGELGCAATEAGLAREPDVMASGAGRSAGIAQKVTAPTAGSNAASAAAGRVGRRANWRGSRAVGPWSESRTRRVSRDRCRHCGRCEARRAE